MSDRHLQAMDASKLQLRTRWAGTSGERLLDRLSEQGVRRSSLAEVLDAPRLPAGRLEPGPPLEGLDVGAQLGFVWSDHDARDERWYPQGITSSALSSPDGRWEGREILLVSWYSKHGEGVRVSAIALEGDEGRGYEHLLLVEPKAAWLGNGVSLRPVRAHAGGIEWCGPYLYVADTIRGLRVFDLREVIELWPEGGAPRGYAAERAAAWGCRWAVPQVGAYPLPILGLLRDRGPRFSFLAASHVLTGEEPATPALVSGEYRSGRPGARIVKWPLATDGSGRLAADGADLVRAERAWTTQRTNLQGVLLLGERMLLASSAGQRPGRLTVHHASGEGDPLDRTWAVGPEDLTYLPARGLVLSATEHPRATGCEACGRVVFGVAAGEVLD